MHIVYIHTHDSGRFLKPYGYDVPTPELMALAKDSTTFTNAHAVAPTCSPSRAGLLTGLYPHQNGMFGLAHRGFGLTDYNHHMVNILKGNGYQTVLCGVQHEAGHWTHDDSAAATIGYDVNLTTSSEGYSDPEMVIWDNRNAQKLADFITGAPADQKLFLSYGLFATHRDYPEDIDPCVDIRYIKTPEAIHQNDETKKDMAQYMTSAKWADDNIKIVLDALKAKGIYDESLIVFTTDHGLANPKMKCSLSDKGTAVALLIRNPKLNQQGQVADALVSHVDVMPTLLDIAGLDVPPNLQGRVFTDIFNDPKARHREAVFSEINYHTSYEPCRAIRTERYKYIKYFDTSFPKYNKSNIDKGPYKKQLLELGLLDRAKPMEQLFDLIDDPGEQNNLVNDADYQSVLLELRQRLTDWQIETNDPLLNGDIPLPEFGIVEKKTCLMPDPEDRAEYELYHLPE